MPREKSFSGPTILSHLGDDQAADPLVQRAIKGEPVASTIIVPREELEGRE